MLLTVNLCVPELLCSLVCICIPLFLFACFSSDSLVYINSNILKGAPCDVQGKRKGMLSSCGYFFYFVYILIFTF